MMLKKQMLAIAASLIFILFVLLGVAILQSKTLQRDPIVLMNKYYRLKHTNPIAAERALQIIVAQNHTYLPALIEWSRRAIHQQQWAQALTTLEYIHQQLPYNNLYTYQLGYVYYVQHNWQQATVLFKQLIKQSRGKLKHQAQLALYAMASYLPNYQDQINIQFFTKNNTVTKHLKSSNTKTTLHALYYDQHYDQQVASSKVLRLQEEGYRAIRSKHYKRAIKFLTRAYKITHSRQLAMQLGYLHNQLHYDNLAYRYFQKVAKPPEDKLSVKAFNAMSHLTGLQTKAFPNSYYGELFFTPFSQSYFGITVTQIIARMGVEQTNKWNTKQYLFLRRTQDNQSRMLGKLPQIYEDNVEIMGIGAQMTPLPGLPITGFIETGAAYDLLFQNRNRWRGDLRGGLMFYQEWGACNAYYPKPTFGFQYYGDGYADATYFSRYNNNVIGVARTHQGIRAFQYKSSVINLYIVGRVIGDTQRLFFNNLGEIGPGIAFIPSNRFNLQIRYEHSNGIYLPAGGITNPYNKYYTNNLIQLLFYVKI